MAVVLYIAARRYLGYCGLHVVFWSPLFSLRMIVKVDNTNTFCSDEGTRDIIEKNKREVRFATPLLVLPYSAALGLALILNRNYTLLPLHVWLTAR